MGFACHKDTRKAKTKQSEEDTNNVVKAINSFINPFEVEDKDVLYCVSSGAAANEGVFQDLLNADELEKRAQNEFITDRLVNKKKSFHAPAH